MTDKKKAGTKKAILLPSGYKSFFEKLKSRIESARIQAVLSANRELVMLYWDIGRQILQRQKQQGWGAKVVVRLAQDLRRAFPDMKGFSRANLLYMRAFAEAYPDKAIVQQAAGQIPWFHNVILVEKVKDSDQRLWYIQKAVENGWSRAVLIGQIESGLYKRQGGAVTNFCQTLPSSQSELAQQTLKDPYIFDFLTLSEHAAERELERGLLEHIRDFLLELGVGFSFVGSQYHLEVEGEDFYIDMLFYHLRLRCFVVIDLKMESFRPEYAGKMNFYLSAVDSRLRRPDDQPSIGIILCKTRKKLIAEYALRNTATPIGVSEYKLTRTIPAKFKSSLPAIGCLEKELAGDKESNETGLTVRKRRGKPVKEKDKGKKEK
jgi:predicted nuclease of restriction endonuclease-like (RecB) superfamily